MKSTHMKSMTYVLVILVVIALCVSSVYTVGGKSQTLLSSVSSAASRIKQDISQYEVTEDTEYWALLFAVGVYYNHPDQDRPSMLESVDLLYDELTDSGYWDYDHIRMVKAEQATGQSLLEGLRWLDNMDDSDDISVVYITTHGFPLRNSNGLPLDIPPKDEPDGADEALVMYHGFENWYSFVWDDLLNFFVSLLDSQGVCLIVDSCYSGGFNDAPFDGIDPFEGYTACDFSEGLAEDLRSQNRIVLMSTEENSLSYGSYFSSFLIEGLEGWGDFFGNQDDIVSAEEAFSYAQFWVDFYLGSDQHPTVRDDYPGELPLIDAWA